MHAENISLLGFLRQLLVQLDGDELPFDLRPWNEFFFWLKVEAVRHGKPGFLKNLSFDWNGLHPTCPELEEALRGLYTVGCLAVGSPRLELFTVRPLLLTLWQNEPVDTELRQYLYETAAKFRARMLGAGQDEGSLSYASS